ncbi:MAG: hypothetical protein QM703_01100 [Gemmatales bacterium]
MSANESPNTPPASSQENLVNMGKNIFERLSLGGKLMCGGAILAILSAFLNEYSVKMTIDNPMLKGMAAHSGGGFMVIEEWRGTVAVLGCIGCGVLALMLFGAKPNPQAKNLTIAALGASGVAVLMAILIWINISRASSAFSGMGAEISAGAGIGAYLILLAGIVCLAGSVLHAKDAKLF